MHLIPPSPPPPPFSSLPRLYHELPSLGQWLGNGVIKRDPLVKWGQWLGNRVSKSVVLVKWRHGRGRRRGLYGKVVWITAGWYKLISAHGLMESRWWCTGDRAVVIVLNSHVAIRELAP